MVTDSGGKSEMDWQAAERGVWGPNFKSFFFWEVGGSTACFLFGRTLREHEMGCSAPGDDAPISGDRAVSLGLIINPTAAGGIRNRGVVVPIIYSLC